MLTRRRPRAGSSGPSPHSKTGWSRNCAWLRSRPWLRPTASWMAIFPGSTRSSSASRGSRKTSTGRCPRGSSSKRSSASKRSGRYWTATLSAGRAGASPSRSRYVGCWAGRPR
ncbi:MAG: hypothetical protein MZV64_63225 [Ignavibacteriales bacterium]|nr:hypothetical protein [Ignavibacteriales bacterium]